MNDRILFSSAAPDNALFVITLGFRVTGGTVPADVWMQLSYRQHGSFIPCQPNEDIPDSEIMLVREWYPGEAYWLSIDFMTYVSIDDEACWAITNMSGGSLDMEYTLSVQRIHSGYSFPRTDELAIEGTITLSANSGLTEVTTLSGLLYQRAYVFDVRVRPETPQDEASQPMVFTWECFKSAADTASWPQVLTRASNHKAFHGDPFFGYTGWTGVSVFVVTKAAGASCKLSVANGDEDAMVFRYRIHYYNNGGMIQIVGLHHNAETESCLVLGPGASSDVTLTNLPAPPDHTEAYFGWAHVRLPGANLASDFEHKSAWYVSYGDPSVQSGLRQGYQMKEWIDFGSVDPRVEGGISHSVSLPTSMLWLHVKNADVESHEYCHASASIKWIVNVS